MLKISEIKQNEKRRLERFKNQEKNIVKIKIKLKQII